jgi:hypothetical protein
MKLANSTDYSDRFLRRMIAWCCHQLDMPVSYVRAARIGNATNHWGGRAYLPCRRIGVRVGSAASCDRELRHYQFRDGFQVITRSRVEVLLVTTAHELAHLDLYRRGNRSRGNGRGCGGSERYTEGRAANVLEAFRRDAGVLLKAWGREAVVAYKPAMTVQQRRAIASEKKLDQWQRKARLAATKVKKYKKQVRYYEKAIAAKQSGVGNGP